MDTAFNPLYYNAIDQIYHSSWAAKKFARLEIFKQSIHRLWPKGHPTELVQVVGTNGKGSVCRYLEAGFSTQGTAGCYVNPHIFDYRERFSVQQQTVNQDDIVEIWEEKIKPICIEQALKGEQYIHSYADIGLLIALSLFEKYQVERAAIETGCGGRYAHATVLDVRAVAITNVGEDHKKTLGSELWQRALDKSGACRPGKPLFSSVQNVVSRRMLESICQALKSPLHAIDIDDLEHFKTALVRVCPAGLPAGSLLRSQHQLWNATLSFALLKHLLPVPNDRAILQRFTEVRFQGRFQQIEDGIYADIAHNPNKIQALVHQVKERFPSQRKIFVIGLSRARSPQEVFAPILTIADWLIVTSASYAGIPPETIQQDLNAINKRKIPLEVVFDPQAALDQAKRTKDPQDIVILTGSGYAIDQMLNPDPYLRHLNASYGWRSQRQD